MYHETIGYIVVKVHKRTGRATIDSGIMDVGRASEIAAKKDGALSSDSPYNYMPMRIESLE